VVLILLRLTKKIFNQGETIHVKIDISNTDVSIVKGTLSLIGREKVEFTIQSFTGKLGYNPGLSFFLPSKHMRESLDFLTQTHSLSLIPKGAREETIELEVPKNAIASYFGDNGKITYFLQLDLELKNGSQKREVEQILVDSSYKQILRTKKIEVNDGKIIIKYKNPLLINSKNTMKISIENLLSIDTLRFTLIGREIVNTSGIIIDKKVCDLPLGQIHFDGNLNDIPIEFQIPKQFQHDYEGLLSRAEYSIEISQIIIRKRFGIASEHLIKLKEIQVNVEYPKIDRSL
jgi:hypothetical protein